MTDTAVAEQPTTRVHTPLTPDQKQAATLRREASMLKKYGNVDQAKELEAKADALAPQKNSTRVDPLKVLSPESQKALRDYFRTTQGFARLSQVVSAKKLQELAGELG